MYLDEVLDVVRMLSSRGDESVEKDLGASVADENSRTMIRVVRLQRLHYAVDEPTDRPAILIRFDGGQDGGDGGRKLGRRRRPRLCRIRRTEGRVVSGARRIVVVVASGGRIVDLRMIRISLPFSLHLIFAHDTAHGSTQQDMKNSSDDFILK